MHFWAVLAAPSLAGTMSDCPVVHPADLERLMSEDPRPRIIQNDSVQLDFITEFGGRLLADGGYDFGEFTIGGRHQPYMLTNAGYTPDIVHKVAARHPVPEEVAHIYQRPVLSVGQRGTGEKDIAHHYHPVTAMLLLQGEKIWALRPPGDVACMMNSGDCTDPMDICSYYAQPRAPQPACVQRAGDTIVVPDGWFHGTCNTALLTVGLGGQGRMFTMELEGRPAAAGTGHDVVGLTREASAQPLFGFLTEPAFGKSDYRGLVRAVERSGSPRGTTIQIDEYYSLGPASQAPLQAIRSMYRVFVRSTYREDELDRAFLDSLACFVLQMPAAPSGSSASVRDVAPGLWATMTSWQHTHVLLPLTPATASLELRFLRRRVAAPFTSSLEANAGALWYGTALDELLFHGPTSAIYCKARVLSGYISRDRELRRKWETWESQ